MIFVDSGAWIALLNRRDQHHDDAVVILNNLGRQNVQLLTTDYVIDETVTWLRYRVSHPVAVQFFDLIGSSRATGVLTLVAIDRFLFQEAERLFRQYTLRGYHLQIALALQFVSSIKSQRRLLSIDIFQ